MVSDWKAQGRRFLIFSLVQMLVLCISIFLCIEEFGDSAWERSNRVGLILMATRETGGWPKEQANGLQRACDDLGYDLYFKENVSAGSGACRQAVEELTAKGIRRIFFANPQLEKDIHAIAPQYPQVQFFSHAVSTGDKTGGVMNYSVRYYELRYLAGVLAGLHTRTGIIGYVAPFPTIEMRRGINAFTLGVQSVRPDARVLLRWTGQWISPEDDRDAVYRLHLAGADVLTYYMATQTVAESAEVAGVDYIDFHKSIPGNQHCLASIETDWHVIYEELLRLNLRSIESEHTIWHGMFHGTVWLWPEKGRLTSREEAQLLSVRSQIEDGLQIFSGNIVDQDGIQRCSEGEVISSGDLKDSMYWLVRGVEIIESK